MKVLAAKWRGLGDTVLWSSAIQALRDAFPAVELDLLLPEPYLPLYDADVRVRRVFAAPASVRDWLSLVPELRRRRYDWFLGFHASARVLWLARLVGARRKALHHHSRRARSYGSDVTIPALGRAMPATERDANLVRALGWRGPIAAPRLTAPAGAREAAARRIASLGETGGRPLVVLGPESTRPAKQWPWERYDDLLRLLEGKARLLVVTRDAKALPEPFRGRWSRAGRLVETRSLADLMGLLAEASCFVSGDSGAKHLACALGTATVTVFGPESVGEWHPYETSRHPVIRREVACRDRDPIPPEYAWCGAHACPLSSHQCTSTVPAEEVARAVARLMSQNDTKEGTAYLFPLKERSLMMEP